MILLLMTMMVMVIMIMIIIMNDYDDDDGEGSDGSDGSEGRCCTSILKSQDKTCESYDINLIKCENTKNVLKRSTRF